MPLTATSVHGRLVARAADDLDSALGNAIRVRRRALNLSHRELRRSGVGSRGLKVAICP
jgi:hypothetical protein